MIVMMVINSIQIKDVLKFLLALPMTIVQNMDIWMDKLHGLKNGHMDARSYARNVNLDML